jgi:hypothetical protein
MNVRNRNLAVFTGTVAAACAIGAGAVATAAPSEHAPLRIHLVEREAGGQFIDTGEKGLSVGDQQVGRSDVLDTKGRRVGRLDGVCTITGVGRALGGLCSGVLTLRDGQIAGQFAWGHSGSSHLQAVVGGTGRYAGARGQFVVDTNGTDEREDFTVVLYGTR